MRHHLLLFVMLLVLITACGEPEDFVSTTVTVQPAGDEAGPTSTTSATPTATDSDDRAETPDATPGSEYSIIELQKPTGTPAARDTFVYDWPLKYESHETKEHRAVVEEVLLSAEDLPDSSTWQPVKLDNQALWSTKACPGASNMIAAPGSTPLQSASFINVSDSAQIDHVIDVKRELPDAGAQISSIDRGFDDTPGCFVFWSDTDATANIILVERLDLELPAVDVNVTHRVHLDMDGDPGTIERELIIAYARIHHVIIGLQYQGGSPLSETHVGDLLNRLTARIATALDATIAQQVIARIPTPTPTYPPIDPEPTIPDLPEVVSCEQAASLILDQLQLLLDAVVDLPAEAISADEPPEGLEELSEEIGGTIGLVFIQAERALCRESEVNWWIAEGLAWLTADGPAAELLLEYFVAAFEDTYRTAPLPTITPDWEITSCQEAAGIFIERTQVFLHNIEGVTIEAFEETLEPSPEFMLYIAEVTHIVEDFRAIGCSDAEVEALILPRLDSLQAQGELAEAIVETLREGIENGGLFQEL